MPPATATAFSVISAMPCSLSGSTPRRRFRHPVHRQADLLGRSPGYLDIGAGFELQVMNLIVAKSRLKLVTAPSWP